MPVTVSTATMVEQLSGLLHTRDVTIREADFIARLVAIRDEAHAAREHRPEGSREEEGRSRIASLQPAEVGMTRALRDFNKGRLRIWLIHHGQEAKNADRYRLWSVTK